MRNPLIVITLLVLTLLTACQGGKAEQDSSGSDSTFVDFTLNDIETEESTVNELDKMFHENEGMEEWYHHHLNFCSPVSSPSDAHYLGFVCGYNTGLRVGMGGMKHGYLFDTHCDYSNELKDSYVEGYESGYNAGYQKGCEYHNNPKPVKTHRCKATMINGSRCKHKAMANGYCTQHWKKSINRSEEYKIRAKPNFKNGKPAKASSEANRCKAITRKGSRCKLEVIKGTQYCPVHSKLKQIFINLKSKYHEKVETEEN